MIVICRDKTIHMKFIDTHTHLYAEAFDEDQQLVIEEAIAAGVDHFFVPVIKIIHRIRVCWFSVKTEKVVVIITAVNFEFIFVATLMAELPKHLCRVISADFDVVND